MSTTHWILIRTLAAILSCGVLARAAEIEHPLRTADSARRDAWVDQHLRGPQAHAPLSFRCGGRPSSELLSQWSTRTEIATLDANRTRQRTTWTDQGRTLEVRCDAVLYADYPVVEWTVYLKNAGTSDTPILEHVQGLDIRLTRAGDSEFVLHGIKGDFCTADSYEPYEVTLSPNAEKHFAPPPYSGKSCDGPDGWPYYNLQWDRGGMILAVGWPGQWASSFVRDAANGLRIAAGQQLTHLVLRPGEEIRTPLIALLFWRGEDVVLAQNLWRRWYMAHVIPRVDGQPPGPLAQIQVNAAEKDIEYVRKFLDAGIHVDLCWRDAGGTYTWYPSSTGPYQGEHVWLNTGTWNIDPAKFPQGFRPFTDWIHARGMKFVLWFEPERVGDPQSWLSQHHPEWLLPGQSHGALLDEGNLDGMIKSQGIDWYREDMNGEGPLPPWRRHDTADRQGMTENQYVQGHLAIWDELLRRNPQLRIDSCASGGRRNDLETMRRAVPLLRSDFQFPTMEGVVEGNQSHTYGLSFWLPFQGTGVYTYDPYSFRSFYLPSFGMGGLSPENQTAQQQAYGECRRIAPFMLRDYYPLTPYSLERDSWIAWQFHDPEQGGGAIQAFRRSDNREPSQQFRLRGLDPDAWYDIRNFDQEGTVQVAGRELLERGVTVEISSSPGSAVLMYHAATTTDES
jgi:alpha-galactosidase